MTGTVTPLRGESAGRFRLRWELCRDRWETAATLGKKKRTAYRKAVRWERGAEP